MNLADIEAIESDLANAPDWELNKILPRVVPGLLKLAREALAAREWLKWDARMAEHEGHGQDDTGEHPTPSYRDWCADDCEYQEARRAYRAVVGGSR